MNGKLIANPSHADLRESKLNIIVAASDDGIVMVEAGATQASEAEVLAAIEFGHENCRKITAAHPRTGGQGRQAEARPHAACHQSGNVR